MSALTLTGAALADVGAAVTIAGGEGAAAIASQSSGRSETIFSCRLRGGKSVSVTRRGDRLTYRYGTPRRSELTIVGSAADRNLFATTHLHGGPTYFTQLRFVRGDYSYVVHSIPRSRTLDNVGSSGLSVFRNGRRIASHDCARWAGLSFADIDAVPEDGEGAPVAWDSE